MKDEASGKSLTDFWRFLVSMRLGLVLMFLLAGAAMLGVLLPREIAGQETSVLARAVKLFGLDNVYATWWFRVLIYVLTLNVLACFTYRAGAVLSVLRSPRMTIDGIERLKCFESFSSTERKAEVVERSIQVLLGNRYHVMQSEEEEHTYLYADKHRIKLAGSLLMHLGLIVLVAGVTWAGIGGFEGTVSVPVGATFQLTDLKQTQGTISDNFSIRLDSVDQQITKAGLRDVLPTLSILDKGDLVKEGTVRFNQPFSYSGTAIHLLNYVDGVLITVNNIPRVIVNGAQNVFPLTQDGSLYVAFNNIFADPNRPTVQYMIITPDNPVPLDQGLLHAGEGKNYPNQFSFSLIGYRGSAVLRVTKQPGLSLVLTGALLLLAGMVLTLFLRYRKIWISVSSEGEQVQVAAGGYSSTQRLRFATEFNALVSDIRALLEG